MYKKLRVLAFYFVGFYLLFVSPVSFEHFRNFLVLNFGSESDAEHVEGALVERNLTGTCAGPVMNGWISGFSVAGVLNVKLPLHAFSFPSNLKINPVCL